MNKLAVIIIYLNLFGLAACQGLESWRWGTISGVVSIGWVWVASFGLISLALMFGSRKEK